MFLEEEVMYCVAAVSGDFDAIFTVLSTSLNCIIYTVYVLPLQKKNSGKVGLPNSSAVTEKLFAAEKRNYILRMCINTETYKQTKLKRQLLMITMHFNLMFCEEKEHFLADFLFLNNL